MSGLTIAVASMLATVFGALPAVPLVKASRERKKRRKRRERLTRQRKHEADYPRGADWDV